MKKLVLTGLMSLGIALCSQVAWAECAQPRSMQKIDIKNIDGEAQVVNKPQSEICEVKNDHANSVIHWTFHDLNCGPGQCLIKPDGDPTLYEKALKCDQGSENNRKCSLNVKKLKSYCDRVDGNNFDACSFNYMIIVHGKEIDPTLIIRPRPLSD